MYFDDTRFLNEISILCPAPISEGMERGSGELKELSFTQGSR